MESLAIPEMTTCVAGYLTLCAIAKGPDNALLLHWMATWGPDGSWFTRTRDEIEAETGLKRTRQEAARAQLLSIGLIDEETRGIPAQLHFRVKFGALSAAWRQQWRGGCGTASKPVGAQPAVKPTAAQTITPALTDHERHVLAKHDVREEDLSFLINKYSPKKIRAGIRWIWRAYDLRDQTVYSFPDLLGFYCDGNVVDTLADDESPPPEHPGSSDGSATEALGQEALVEDEDTQNDAPADPATPGTHTSPPCERTSRPPRSIHEHAADLSTNNGRRWHRSATSLASNRRRNDPLAGLSQAEIDDLARQAALALVDGRLTLDQDQSTMELAGKAMRALAFTIRSQYVPPERLAQRTHDTDWRPAAASNLRLALDALPVPGNIIGLDSRALGDLRVRAIDSLLDGPRRGCYPHQPVADLLGDIMRDDAARVYEVRMVDRQSHPGAVARARTAALRVARALTEAARHLLRQFLSRRRA